MAQVEHVFKYKMVTVEVGDTVEIDGHIDQYGVVEAIDGPWISLAVTNGMTGKTNTVHVHECLCWMEG